MSKKHQIYWNKKKGTTATVNAVAPQMSLKDGRPVLNPVSPGKAKAFAFMSNLKTAIRKATIPAA